MESKQKVHIDKISSEKKSLAQWTVIFTLFAACAAVSLVPVHFPMMAKTEHISDSLVGVIFSAFSVSMATTAVFCGSHMQQFGRKHIFLIGAIISIFSIAAFSVISMFPDPVTFVSAALVSRIFQGAGQGMLMTAGQSILTFYFPNEIPKLMSRKELAFGLGFTLGPLIGGEIDHELNFFWSFIIICIPLICGTLMTFSAIPSDESPKGQFPLEKTLTESLLENPDQEQRSKAKLMDLLSDSRALYPYLAILASYISVSFFRVLFSVRITSLYPPLASHLGIMWAIGSCTYLLGAYGIRKVPSDCLNRQVMITIQLSGLAFALFMAGPFELSNFFSLPVSVPLMLFGFVINGLFFGSLAVTAGVELIHVGKEICGNHSKMNDIASAAYFNGLAFGEVLGPLLAGFGSDALGFRSTFTLCGILICFLAVFGFGKHTARERGLKKLQGSPSPVVV